MNIEQSIAEGIQALELVDIPDTAVERLAAFLRLLDRWNRIYNLTAVRRVEDMVSRHILDSLSIEPWLRGSRILDIGSGAGLPGIPLAIVRPTMAFYLLDSSSKRTRFMIQVVAALKLSNVTVVHCRIEDYDPKSMFDCIVSRAFASLPVMLNNAGRLCAPEGCLLAMKGTRPDAELTNLPPNYTLVRIYPLQVPKLQAERHLIQLAPVLPGRVSCYAEESIY